MGVAMRYNAGRNSYMIVRYTLKFPGIVCGIVAANKML
jgi:hypothetical protein